MAESAASPRSERYTGLSDRFRSLWTFYQFLAGVFKHQGKGTIPFHYDFQALYRRLQELVPRMGFEEEQTAARELDQVERELTRIQTDLARFESEFAPSTLRRFFDHLKRQDEKILFALVKFYLLGNYRESETLDKLDILLTRLSEAPLEDGRVLQRDPAELEKIFERLAEFAGVPQLAPDEEKPLIEAVREFRRELENIGDFSALLTSRVYDRFRGLKHNLGAAYLHPPILVEIIATNIEGKNRFKQLYQEEEIRILEDTNKIFEIERHLERNPDVGHESLTHQIALFRQFRARFDSGRKDDNVKREDILELRRTMQAVLDAFDPLRGPDDFYPLEPSPVTDEESGNDAVEVPEVLSEPLEEAAPAAEPPPAPRDAPPPLPSAQPEAEPEPAPHLAPAKERGTTSISDLLPPDPLLNEALHKIVFALELVAWDHQPEQAVQTKELFHLHLEPWEVKAYRQLADGEAARGTAQWELQAFYLYATALRVKMEEEIEDIARLCRAGKQERLLEMLDRAAQSLERAREFHQRFQWFVDDMLYRGTTERLEQIYRSQFRFLHAYSRLWLAHNENGGITPL